MAKVDKHYISEIDKRNTEFDRTHPKSASQSAEIKKYQRIYQLRDQVPRVSAKKETDNEIWQDF